mmetsp:Transcript_38089/g.77780  ORF Transcript_38089/g.77780 Transcript_38089/m.77780 type:complete len:400 (+) Transcript_38089:81-1280(+)|eukprot:CAMPEP_0113415200 /NCGR_PEP_ID=MMETSP0013_2-20120614/24437_1 /TAXON_ID=2843 ORGANISM="Skeletonema costatum, Strain 1716" /NCGR_SAMPLE_ID=MMETSP0013_2 /ASSEMBLY_ACC=CAM_ASM_000158 /LENGTH=399 /DNA_ID=CAMNT_0000302135 /DNA_START=38 /DNA_END=1237 /DNA_ORIENTATION=+ /assembly_acc=CAM_ASM_000158
MGMKKESKKAKKKSKKEEDAVDVSEDLADAPDFDVDGNNNNSDNEQDEEPKKKSKKKKSKSSKKRPLEDDEEDDGDGDDSKSDSKVDRATRKAIKKEQKEALMAKIPKLDPDGIPYSKIQIRRMLRRVKHGLDPVATEEEEREIRAREKREKAEEERLLFAERNDEDDQEEKEEGGDKDEEAVDSKVDQEEEDKEEEAPAAPKPKEPAQDAPKKKSHNPPSKKTKRSKPVPPDYICQACQNNLPNFTPHWIYDCPNKITQRGCNTVAKRLRGLHDPPSRKVFVSGLPFECSEGHVKRYFEQNMDGTDATESIELVHCKLLKFEDSTRCKGQAFLTFDSDLGAQLALKLNGSVWEDVEEPGVAAKKTKKNGTKESSEKKELKLKVTKVLARHVTKKKFGK